MENALITDQTRQHYFDFLRVFATFIVMLLHVSIQNESDMYSFEWVVMNFYHSISRWGVPVFVMISGALFLSRDIPIRKIYSKYIFRIFTAFVFWSFIYAVKDYMKYGDILNAFKFFLRGEFHMWFLFMIAGLYVIVPFVKKIAESEFLTKYFLVLAFIFSFVMPWITDIISVFSEEYGKFSHELFSKPMLYFTAGYTSYFLLGYVLNKTRIPTKTERVIYVVGSMGFAATVLMSLYASYFRGKPFGFYSNHSINVLCEALAVFVFFKAKFSRPSLIVRALSQYSFGAYLVHTAVMIVLRLLGILGNNTMTFSPVLSIPVISVIVFIISFAISAILNHIPVLNKYIV